MKRRKWHHWLCATSNGGGSGGVWCYLWWMLSLRFQPVAGSRARAGHFLLQLIYRRLLFFFPLRQPGGTGAWWCTRGCWRDKQQSGFRFFSSQRAQVFGGDWKERRFSGWKVLDLILFCQLLDLTVFAQAELRMSARLQLINPFLGCFYIFFHVSLVIQHMPARFPMFSTSVECFPSNDGWVGDFSASL